MVLRADGCMFRASQHGEPRRYGGCIFVIVVLPARGSRGPCGVLQAQRRQRCRCPRGPTGSTMWLVALSMVSSRLLWAPRVHVEIQTTVFLGSGVMCLVFIFILCVSLSFSCIFSLLFSRLVQIRLSYPFLLFLFVYFFSFFPCCLSMPCGWKGDVILCIVCNMASSHQTQKWRNILKSYRGTQEYYTR